LTSERGRCLNASRVPAVGGIRELEKNKQKHPVKFFLAKAPAIIVLTGIDKYLPRL